MRRRCHLSGRAFSLVELVIVIVIVGIIAAIAVPRISRGANGGRDAALRANLHVLRTAIDRFAAEHDGLLPAKDGNTGTFWGQLTKETTKAGLHTGTDLDFGPYLMDVVEQTVGPTAGKSRILFSTSSPPTVVESPPNSGWVYNNQTGEIISNTDDLDNNGVGYNTY